MLDVWFVEWLVGGLKTGWRFACSSGRWGRLHLTHVLVSLVPIRGDQSMYFKICIFFFISCNVVQVESLRNVIYTDTNNTGNWRAALPLMARTISVWRALEGDLNC